jgi:anti-anti-sigma factor
LRSAQSTLAVDVRPEGQTVTVRLDGDLDITSSPLLQAVVDQALAARREPICTRLVVDMSGVGFADASGISPLLLARAMLAKRSGSIELRRCRRSVLRLVRLLDLEDMLAAEVAAPPVG